MGWRCYVTRPQSDSRIDMSQKLKTARGISLYTLLAAVVVLGVLGSTLVTQFDGTQTKSAAVMATALNVSQAAERYHLDTSCYPATLSALTSYSNDTASNSCGKSITRSAWDGPYVKQFGLNASGQAPVEQYGPGATLELRYGGGNALIVFNNLTDEIQDKALSVCEQEKGAENCEVSGSQFGFRYNIGGSASANSCTPTQYCSCDSNGNRTCI